MINNKKTFHSFCDDALADHDAVEIARLLKSKAISHKDVTDAAIARAYSVNPKINAIATECFEKASSESHTLGRGYFAGVPTFIKDNTPVKGLPTQHGSDAIRAKPEKKHGPYTRQYINLGFSVLGKSTLPEFGLNATTEPVHAAPTRNPWNIEYSTGASSGGSAALVAAGVVPVAHANDGGGSIRIPAACCGLIGLKPSRGRHVDSDQAKLLPINLISEGIVSRTVRDTAYFHHEAEKYFRNKRLPEIGLVEGPSHKRLRVGLMIDSITGYETDEQTRVVVHNTATLLSDMGHYVEEMPMQIPKSFIEDFSLYWSMLAFMTQKTGKIVMDRSFNSDRLDPLSLGLAGLFKKNYHKTPLFLYRLRQTQRDYAKAFSQYDVILTPVLAHTTPTLGHISPTVPFDELFSRLMQYVSFTPWANASGGPALSLPMGQTPNNLPISVQLMAGHGQERTLLEVAYEIEQAQAWRKIHA
ncbi:amidase [Alkalimarinus alittae]|uniref:Amidase n=1 Tax=Alkalimarinus alittae TaxID=2961619 RepID=A0ABY6N246_9ALTE|nr:amidase [Alkalimarinus alittae]UZE96067.1 amidase [Alkalimarinus alittae]